MVFQTPRLFLRQLTPEDARHFYELNLDPDVIRYTGNLPFESVEHAREFLENYDHYEHFGYGRWATLLRDTGEWIGWCGLKFEEEFGATDVGYRFFKKHWGKGYATESARASLKYGFEKLGLKRIEGRAAIANPASIRVLQKIGMQYVKDFIFDGMVGVVYEAFPSPQSTAFSPLPTVPGPQT